MEQTDVRSKEEKNPTAAKYEYPSKLFTDDTMVKRHINKKQTPGSEDLTTQDAQMPEKNKSLRTDGQTLRPSVKVK